MDKVMERKLEQPASRGHEHKDRDDCGRGLDVDNLSYIKNNVH
jgi:hypothetical protein